MELKLDVKNIDNIFTVVKEIKGPYWELIIDPFPQLFDWLKDNSNKGEGLIGIYYDDPLRKDPSECIADFGIITKTEEKEEIIPGYKPKKFTNLTVLTTEYIGKMDSADKVKVYNLLKEWIKNSDKYKYNWEKPVIEIYKDYSLREGKEGKTIIMFPLKER